MKRSDIELAEKYLIALSRENFYAYRQFISGMQLKTGWFTRSISYEIQRFYEDYCAGKRPKLVIQAPPQHGKSVLTADALSWMAGKNPNLRIIFASYSERLGIRANLWLRRTIVSPKYASIFPDTRINSEGKRNATAEQMNSEFIEFVGSRGSFRNTTINGSVTGETLDIGVIDDPVKDREAANSAAIREKTWDWYTDTFSTRFDENAAQLIVLTRWHKDDMVGRLLDIDPSVRVVTYKAIAEEEEEYRSVGEALFPEHKSLEFLLEKKGLLAESNWQALYQQNPVILGGNLFKSEWWQWYDPYATLPRITRRWIYADTALKTKEKNDYSTFQCWGKAYNGGIYLLDLIRGKWEAPQLLETAKAFHAKHAALNDVRGMARLSGFKIEDKASGTGLIQTLKQQGYPVVAIQRNTDKYTRALDVCPILAQNIVYIPRGAEWVSDYLAEHELFPNGVNDDMVDATMDALEDLYGGRGYFTDYDALR